MVIIETPIFTKLVQQHLSEEGYKELQEHLAALPDSGDLIPGSGGLRKIRWKAQGRGKRGGVRVIYYWRTSEGQILMLYIYPKSIRDNLSSAQLKLLKEIVDQEDL